MSSCPKSNSLRPLLCLSLLILVLFALSACAQTPPVVISEAEPIAPEAATAGGALTLALATEPQTLDPAAGFTIAERFILPAIFDTLVRADSKGDLHPGLAESWERNAEATEFTLNLRNDVTFHDGASLDSAAVKAAFDRIQAYRGLLCSQPAHGWLPGRRSDRRRHDQSEL